MCVCLCVTDHILQAVNATGDLAFLTLWLLQVASNPFSINCKIHVTYEQKKGNKVVVVVVRERLSKYSSRHSSGCGGVLNVGKRTPSDPMESVGRDQSPSDIIASQFARDLVNIHHGIVLDVVGC